MRQITVNRGGVAMLHDTASPTAPNALALLQLPDLAALTEDQKAGRACVWGGGRLRLDTAVDLGETLHDGMHVFPQSCWPCIADRAYRALGPHSVDCEPCHDRDHWRDCPIGGALHQLRVDAQKLGQGACS
ncbi:hypothetical protein [Streptomyces sp. SID4982]|uniref:hypothetical protein n=1 Tax=Streptomyces sp. SID4982 TaxID=2690291 RepID=UPI0013705791|nr:hypothetical protein [Streptomyces sp. SID4982]MYS16889.1 hypothetical protein [Streptomyces sp. SID4982]